MRLIFEKRRWQSGQLLEILDHLLIQSKQTKDESWRIHMRRRVDGLLWSQELMTPWTLISSKQMGQRSSALSVGGWSSDITHRRNKLRAVTSS